MKKTRYLDEQWDFLQMRVAKLKNNFEDTDEVRISNDECMTLYSTVFNICTHPRGYSQQLYQRFPKLIKDYISSTVLPPLRDKNNGESLLRELLKRWSNHKTMVSWLTKFFGYLERYRKPVPTLTQVGFTCFRNQVFDAEFKNGKIIPDVVISMIRREREGEGIDRDLLKKVIDIFVEIGMGKMDCYKEDFEAAMLIDTAAYYSREASKWIQEDSFPDYMLKVEECLEREKERVAPYLHPTTETKLLEKARCELLTVYVSQVLEKQNSGCHALLLGDQDDDGKRGDDLSRMYCLFAKTPKFLDHVAEIFKQLITAPGNALVHQAKDAAKAGLKDQLVFVRNLIELHQKYLAYVSNCFMNHSLFHKALKEAFEVFWNKGSTVAGISSTELLATFCDNFLKKVRSDKLGQETLENVVRLLSYISDKDLFEESYRKKLSRRLLLDQSSNYDNERSFLRILKQQCGGKFTSKLEMMVIDLTVAREKQTYFEEYLNNNPQVNPGIDLSVTVLTTAFWPSYTSFTLNLPPEMVKCVEVFREFYRSKTKDRELTWIYPLGTCHIIGKFDQKNVELITSTHQASVLLLFNASERLSYHEIMTQLNLPDDEVARLLHSLSCGKYKILNKEPNNNTKTISPTDVFEFNSKFTHKMRRIKIPLPPQVEDNNNNKVIEDVHLDRRCAIDAAILRIIKSRKALGCLQLVMECVEQLSPMFKPDAKSINKRIEELIDRDYMERDKDNPNLLKYLP